jgi:hypothetical protein
LSNVTFGFLQNRFNQAASRRQPEAPCLRTGPFAVLPSGSFSLPEIKVGIQQSVTHVLIAPSRPQQPATNN